MSINKQVKPLEFRAWEDVLYPLGIYYVLSTIFLILAEAVLGGGEKNYMLWQVVASAFALPAFYFMFYRPDRMLYPNKLKWSKELAKKSIWIVGIALVLGLGLNNILMLSPLAAMSKGYAKASGDFYAGALVWELIGSALLIPLLEEMVYRGVIFTKLRRRRSFVYSALITSFLFGLMHFNVMQFIYAFCFGFALALFVEYTGHVYGAVLAHMAANAFAILRTETGFLSQTLTGAWWNYLFALVLLAISGFGLYLIWKKTDTI